MNKSLQYNILTLCLASIKFDGERVLAVPAPSQSRDVGPGMTYAMVIRPTDIIDYGWKFVDEFGESNTTFRILC